MIISYLSSAIPWAEINEQWGLDLSNEHHVVQYNIQSGDGMTVIHGKDEKMCQRNVVYGFGRPPGFTLNNARREGVFSQSSFRFLIRNQRCLIPIDSFYQVHRHPIDGITVYRCYPTNGKSLLVAGVMSEDYSSAVILTKPSGLGVNEISERCPVTFDTIADATEWLFTTNMAQVDQIMSNSNQEWGFHVTTNELLHSVNTPLLHKAVHKDLTLFD